jgi:hypothetical protein
MGKLCSLWRHTTFLLSGIAGLPGKVVKTASQHVDPLFMGVEFSAKFLCNLCSIYWSNHPRAFVGMVEGKLLSNFHIQSLVHFCLEFWRNFVLKVAAWNGLAPEHALPRDVAPLRATSAPSYPDHARTPRRQKNPRSEAGAVATVDLRFKTHGSGLGRCHAASPHSPAGEPPSTFGRRPAARRHRLRAHVGAPIGHKARAKPPRRVVEPIKPLPFLSSRVPEPHCSPTPPAVSAAGELAAPLAPVANRRP